jgi:hypothetical protein
MLTELQALTLDHWQGPDPHQVERPVAGRMSQPEEQPH